MSWEGQKQKISISHYESIYLISHLHWQNSFFFPSFLTCSFSEGVQPNPVTIDVLASSKFSRDGTSDSSPYFLTLDWSLDREAASKSCCHSWERLLPPVLVTHKKRNRFLTRNLHFQQLVLEVMGGHQVVRLLLLLLHIRKLYNQVYIQIFFTNSLRAEKYKTMLVSPNFSNTSQISIFFSQQMIGILLGWQCNSVVQEYNLFTLLA